VELLPAFLYSFAKRKFARSKLFDLIEVKLLNHENLAKFNGSELASIIASYSMALCLEDGLLAKIERHLLGNMTSLNSHDMGMILTGIANAGLIHSELVSPIFAWLLAQPANAQVHEDLLLSTLYALTCSKHLQGNEGLYTAFSEKKVFGERIAQTSPSFVKNAVNVLQLSVQTFDSIEETTPKHLNKFVREVADALASRAIKTRDLGRDDNLELKFLLNSCAASSAPTFEKTLSLP
jgi:hypothetical protein